MLLLQIIFWITGAFWLLTAVMMIRATLSLKHLPPLQSFHNPPPTLSVLIAVRDEAARIEKTVRQVLAQQGVNLQLIVINDRSRDATPQILDSTAKWGFPRASPVTAASRSIAVSVKDGYGTGVRVMAGTTRDPSAARR